MEKIKRKKKIEREKGRRSKRRAPRSLFIARNERGSGRGEAIDTERQIGGGVSRTVLSEKSPSGLYSRPRERGVFLSVAARDLHEGPRFVGSTQTDAAEFSRHDPGDKTSLGRFDCSGRHEIPNNILPPPPPPPWRKASRTDVEKGIMPVFYPEKKHRRRGLFRKKHDVEQLGSGFQNRPERMGPAPSSSAEGDPRSWEPIRIVGARLRPPSEQLRRTSKRHCQGRFVVAYWAWTAPAATMQKP